MEIESTDIPSDTESVDDVCGSDDESDEETIMEGNIVDDKRVEVDTECHTNDNDADESNVEDDIKEESDDEDVEWKREGQIRDNTPFTSISGPNIPDSAKSPAEIFFCLFSNDLIDKIVEETNLYISQKTKSSKNQKQKKLEPVTRQEMITFIGINILMGIKKFPSYRDYWSMNSQLKDSYISSIMPLNRFSFLLNHLHDNSKEPKKGQHDYDKLYKIRPMLDELSATFKNSWNPGRNQSIDESMIKFKGRSSIKQYMPNKPIKRGYKVWVRADQSGFVCEFQLYTGKHENSAEKNLGTRVVKDLTRAIIGNYHHVYFDNFFTSVDLLMSLKIDKIMACGTIRQNRKGLPKNPTSDKIMKRGDIDFRTSRNGIAWIKWKDNRAVFAASNFHDPSETSYVKRKLKDGTMTEITRPTMIQEYNEHMGYVDKADMLKSLYEIDRKSKKWWLRIFWHFVDVFVTNAFLIFNEKGYDVNMKLKSFRLNLVNGLLGATVPRKQGRKSKFSAAHSYQKLVVPIEKRLAPGSHLPIYSNNRRRCALCSTKQNEMKTNWTCKFCEVPLCLGAVKNCFVKFHST